jgi:hypothetical protein
MGRTACTEPQCLYKGDHYLTVELYLYSSYGPYGLYKASVPVQGWPLPYSRAIPLLLLWALWPLQSLSACTRVHFTFSSSWIHPAFSAMQISWKSGIACNENNKCWKQKLLTSDLIFCGPQAFTFTFVGSQTCVTLQVRWLYKSEYTKRAGWGGNLPWSVSCIYPVRTSTSTHYFHRFF